jgi:hypothetical protein
MKKIELTRGQTTLVDDKDFEWLNSFHWYLHIDKWGKYAVRQKMIKGKLTCYSMHREILKRYGLLIKKFVDHINHNGLDNRKSNLRTVTDSENQMNRQSFSGYKGVTSYRTGKWRASAKLNQKNIHLGYFETKELAAEAYNRFAKENFGDFAYLNQIQWL